MPANDQQVRPGSQQRRRVVACLGASATEARGSYDWIRDLERRPNHHWYRFRRFAAGGDLAYNGLLRLPKVIRCRPDYAIVLLGENDVLARVFNAHYRIVRIAKRLPCPPSVEWFRENMLTIVRRLRKETQARIALCSLIPIGEAPNSENPLQAQANRLIEEYSSVLKEIASGEEVSYLPLYEQMQELILASPGRSFTSFNFLSFQRDAIRQYVLHKSHDEIAQLNGWRFHRDGIHLNTGSGRLLADLVQRFIGA